jgi:hypothetical protein
MEFCPAVQDSKKRLSGFHNFVSVLSSVLSVTKRDSREREKEREKEENYEIREAIKSRIHA